MYKFAHDFFRSDVKLVSLGWTPSPALARFVKANFPGFEDRLQISAGEAEISPEKERKILDEIYFYPPAQPSYTCSICGRACDVACYCHLEEKGVLKKTFKTPFRTRPEWKFSLSDFQ